MSKNEMVTFTYDWNLYDWGDRAYEDCIAHVTVELPDDWEKNMPLFETECKVTSITLQEDTESFLKNVYRTDISKLIEELQQDIRPSEIEEEISGYIFDTYGEEYYLAWSKPNDTGN